MRDYVKSRPAKVGEKLRTQQFQPGTVGFAAPEDANTAVCVLFDRDKVQPTRFVRMEGDTSQSHDGHLSTSQ
jgi:hypothetical protein